MINIVIHILCLLVISGSLLIENKSQGALTGKRCDFTVTKSRGYEKKVSDMTGWCSVLLLILSAVMMCVN